MKRVIGKAGIKLGYWELKAAARIGNKGIGHMAYLASPISQPSLDISPIRIPLISSEVRKSQGRSV
jgi:hypothetical protein